MDNLGTPQGTHMCVHTSGQNRQSLHSSMGNLVGKEPAPALQNQHSLVLPSFTCSENYTNVLECLDRIWALLFTERWQLGLVFLQH